MHTMNKLLAQLTIDGGNGGAPIAIPGTGTRFGGGQIGFIIGAAVPYIFAAAGIGLLLMIISSGFTMMLAAGDAKKLEAGKSRLTQAVVGFLIVFAAYWIVQLAGVIFGWSSIGTSFGT